MTTKQDRIVRQILDLLRENNIDLVRYMESSSLRTLECQLGDLLELYRVSQNTDCPLDHRIND